jgi:hypothetical protein
MTQPYSYHYATNQQGQSIPWLLDDEIVNSGSDLKSCGNGSKKNAICGRVECSTIGSMLGLHR